MGNKKPWSRPQYSAYPNRPGDRRRTPLYTALGRAVSNWEGVSAATASLFRAMLEGDERSDPAERAAERFGEIWAVQERARLIGDQCGVFLMLILETRKAKRASCSVKSGL
jgi:hypothetical protein